MSTINRSEGSLGHIKADVKRQGKKAATSPLMEALTRLGYGVRGLIYVTMGLLAFNVALGKGGAPVDQQAAINAIGSQPAGMFLLWAVLLGLISYSLWGIIRAVLDPLQKGNDMKGLIERAGFLFSAASYAILILPTYRTVTGAGQSASGAQQQSMTSIMSMSWGPIVIGILGLIVIAAGVYQIMQGINASFDRQFQTYAMNATEIRLATQLGRFGTATRGVIFALIGGLMCLAATQSNPNQPVGLDAALATLLKQPYGVFLLGVVAFGLIAFGVYSMLSAAWFRIKK
jgi:large-conductance mechanosensitive channel